MKLEPGLLQEIPRRAAGPLKVEIHDSLLDSGANSYQLIASLAGSPQWPSVAVPDIDGALIIAEQEELAGNNVTLDYVINENGTCTCKLCGEVTQSRTHWYRHKYKVKYAHTWNWGGLIWHKRDGDVDIMQVHNVCLFRCEKCEIFFKSKKGYEGHVANRHTPR